jgi:hypothetical protein
MNTRTKWLTSKDYQSISEDLSFELSKFIEEMEENKMKYGTKELIDFFESFLNDYRIIEIEDGIVNKYPLPEKIINKYMNKAKDNCYSKESLLEYLYNIILRKDNKSISSREFYHNKRRRF